LVRAHRCKERICLLHGIADQHSLTDGRKVCCWGLLEFITLVLVVTTGLICCTESRQCPSELSQYLSILHHLPARFLSCWPCVLRLMVAGNMSVSPEAAVPRWHVPVLSQYQHIDGDLPSPDLCLPNPRLPHGLCSSDVVPLSWCLETSSTMLKRNLSPASSTAVMASCNLSSSCCPASLFCILAAATL
jgi:hypothetical protein